MFTVLTASPMIAKKESRFDFESRTEHETTACTYTPYMGQMGPPRIPNLYYDSVENRLPGDILGKCFDVPRHDIDFFVVAPTHARLCVDPPPHLR